MTDQNSVTDHPVRPDALMEELGIKKDAYYAYLKHLGFKPSKDSDGKAYLSQEQADLLRSLRQHVVETGKMEGFPSRNDEAGVEDTQETEETGAIVATTEDSLTEPVPPTPQTPGVDLDLEKLILEAAELKGHQLALPDLVKLRLAERMTWDDLPAHVKAKVETVREMSSPNFQPATIANDLLAKWRRQQTEKATA